MRRNAVVHATRERFKDRSTIATKARIHADSRDNKVFEGLTLAAIFCDKVERCRLKVCTSVVCIPHNPIRDSPLLFWRRDVRGRIGGGINVSPKPANSEY